LSGLHTLLWLPRAFQMRRELRAAEGKEARGEGPPNSPGASEGGEDNHGHG